MFALPADFLYLLIIGGAMLVPLLIGCFIATSNMIAPGIDNWYQSELSEEALRQAEAELDMPLEFSDDEVVYGEVMSEPRNWLKGGNR